MDGNTDARRWEKAIRLRRQQSAEESIKECGSGCLFRLDTDPSERDDRAAAEPALLAGHSGCEAQFHCWVTVAVVAEGADPKGGASAPSSWACFSSSAMAAFFLRSRLFGRRFGSAAFFGLPFFAAAAESSPSAL